jgi:cytochrome c-type biogenesis protein CcmH/NrfG
VARGTQHRKRRPTQNARAATVAAPAHRQKPPQWQEELFFQRLRNHAKPIFALLALMFALTFVFLGVGSGSNGISDALQNFFGSNNGAGGSSISGLQKKTQKDPLNAKAWRDLATAYETKHDVNNAIIALAQYVGLKSNDTSAIAELASEYTQQAQNYANDYTNAQEQVANATPVGAAFAPASTTPLGKAFADPNSLKDPISAAVQTLASNQETTAYGNYQTAQSNAEQTYQKLVKQTPSDANAQLELGQAAQAAQDTKVAIAAYGKFLKLAPKDPLASTVKTQLKQLKAATAVSSSTTSSK